MGLIILNEIVRFLSSDRMYSLIIAGNVLRFKIGSPGDTLNVADFVSEFDTVIFIRMFQQFRSESRGNELGIFRMLVDHISYSFTMLSIKGLHNVELKIL